MSCKPDFLGIGAQKAATTWLYQNLSQHPRIFMPMKEVHYFDWPAAPGPQLWNGLRGGPEARRWRAEQGRHLRRLRREPLRALSGWLRDLGPRDDAWYLSLFCTGPGRVRGEITPAYATLDEAGVARVHALLPELKLIFLMRDPIDRIWSAYRMKHGGVEGAEHDAARCRDFFRSPDTRARTAYLDTLLRWRRFYPSERIFLGFYEEVVERPAALLLRLLRFLGVEEEPGLLSRVGAPVYPGRALAIPAAVERMLAEQLLGDLEELAAELPGPPERWLARARAILARS